MNIDEDTSEWLGCPTPLEMYKHQCALLEDELTETQNRLNKARSNIAGLIQINDLLTTGKSKAYVELEEALKEISRMNHDNSELARKIRSLELVASQRDHLFNENQRLLMELKVYRQPLS
ncbi:hypothetical protein ACQRBV_22440 [Pseudomonas sp. R11F]|uniref:hypothetical protein n=1 Tax=Pseudomonas TaxID=286 RepID=UPI00398E9A15